MSNKKLIEINFYTENDKHLAKIYSIVVPPDGSRFSYNLDNYEVAWTEWELNEYTERTATSYKEWSELSANVFLKKQTT